MIAVERVAAWRESACHVGIMCVDLVLCIGMFQYVSDLNCFGVSFCPQYLLDAAEAQAWMSEQELFLMGDECGRVRHLS